MTASVANLTETQYINSVFTAPVQTIYNHHITSCLGATNKAGYLYSGRALGITEPGDIIQLHPALESEWVDISRHYERIGLSFARDVMWNVDKSMLRQYPEYRPSFFFYGEDSLEGYSNQGFYDIANRISSKNNFIYLVEKFGLPMPQTFLYENKFELNDFAKFSYPCYLKAASPVVGSGNYLCENEQALMQSLNAFDGETAIQVQEAIIPLCFLTVQYRATARGLQRFAITEQLFNGSNISGHRHPSKYVCWNITDLLAEYLYDQGIEGVFSFDVAVSRGGDKLDYRLLSCSPRFSDASYPAWIAKKLNIDCWTEERFSTKHRTLSKLDLAGLEFNAQSKEGLVLVNWGGILEGEVGVLIAGTATAQKKLRLELLQRL